MPWSVIGGLAPIVGGAIDWFTGRNDRRDDQARQDNQLSRLVDDAKKSGISPLAALGAGLDYGKPVGSSGSAGAGSRLGDAVSQAAAPNTKHARQMRQADLENARLQNDLTRAQIDNLKADTLRATSRTWGNGPGGGSAEAKAAQDAALEALHPNPLIEGVPGRLTFLEGMERAAQDADDWSAAYGDWVGNLYGMKSFASDWGTKQSKKGKAGYNEWRGKWDYPNYGPPSSNRTRRSYDRTNLRGRFPNEFVHSRVRRD